MNDVFLLQLATVSSKGQVTIRGVFLNRLGLHKGDKVEVSVRDGAMIVTPTGLHGQPRRKRK